jgi:hypothetical protein
MDFARVQLRQFVLLSRRENRFESVSVCLGQTHIHHILQTRDRISILKASVTLFWDIKPFTLADRQKHFRGTFCLHLILRMEVSGLFKSSYPSTSLHCVTSPETVSLNSRESLKFHKFNMSIIFLKIYIKKKTWVYTSTPPYVFMA